MQKRPPRHEHALLKGFPREQFAAQLHIPAEGPTAERVMDLLNQPQYWYFAMGTVWSIFQGVRGVVETRLDNPQAGAWKPWERIVVLYIHDFALRFICTMAGFLSLYMAVILFNEIIPDGELSAGDSLLLLFLFLIGVTGVVGQLHSVILIGKRPSTKSSR